MLWKTSSSSRKLADEYCTSKLGAVLATCHAVASFDPDGTIIDANAAFLQLFDYSMAEVLGQNHRILMMEDEVRSADYGSFWSDLLRGTPRQNAFVRKTRTGNAIWVEASYIPIAGKDGQIIRIVKLARDVTQRRAESTAARTKIAAIEVSLATVEFEPDGTIITANENFCRRFGYELKEIQGRHHRIFVDSRDAVSPEYEKFWAELGRGNFCTGEFKRIARDGSTVWIQGSYNPVTNVGGKVYKVIKFASDVTPRVKALESVSEGLHELAAGRLTARVPDSVDGEFAEMRDSFNGTIVQLSDLVSKIRGHSDRIAEETDVIATSVQNLSSRNEKQAARVEETSAAMTQMETAIQSNAENTKTAMRRADEAVKVARSGSNVVCEAIASMEEIKQVAKNIRRVNEVIDSIAFQTNLLALNAGVEAARAGDAGRGFAVVASEVRALAQRAADAARDINDLVQKSQDSVAHGSALVSRSGDALSEIVTSVSAFADTMRDISNATSEQAQGISSVRQAISDIDITTQRTAAIAEESAAASTQLAQRAIEMRELVSIFDDGTPPQVRNRYHAHTSVEENVAYLPPAERQAAVGGSWADF